jgi:hypothetical protein
MKKLQNSDWRAALIRKYWRRGAHASSSLSMNQTLAAN